MTIYRLIILPVNIKIILKWYNRLKIPKISYLIVICLMEFFDEILMFVYKHNYITQQIK